MNGHVIATGRPDRFPRAAGLDVSREEWFIRGKAVTSGDDFVAVDVMENSALSGAIVATFATAVRSGGESHGTPLGVLGIHFDWAPQAAAVVNGVRLGADEASSTRCLLIDSNHRIIAASDNQALLKEKFDLRTDDRTYGNYLASSGNIVGFSLTSGFEIYKGMGWYGVITQKLTLPPRSASHSA